MGVVLLCYVFERNCDTSHTTPMLFDRGGGVYGTISLLDAIRRCTCADDASTASAWAVPLNKKEQK